MRSARCGRALIEIIKIIKSGCHHSCWRQNRAFEMPTLASPPTVPGHQSEIKCAFAYKFRSEYNRCLCQSPCAQLLYPTSAAKIAATSVKAVAFSVLVNPTSAFNALYIQEAGRY
jgi:hypothetical protein